MFLITNTNFSLILKTISNDMKYMHISKFAKQMDFFIIMGVLNKINRRVP